MVEWGFALDSISKVPLPISKAVIHINPFFSRTAANNQGSR